MINCFAPIVSKYPKVLILGSIPSVVSLEKQQYYGYKHNRFWKIMAAFFKMDLDDYEKRKRCIIEHNMALWDVIASCEREGSLDSKIRKEVCNDIEGLIKKYPSIQYVICNGKKSYALYQKHFSHLPLKVYTLPSTSNANRTIKETDLFDVWCQTLYEILN